jgi:hypothetical protein
MQPLRRLLLLPALLPLVACLALAVINPAPPVRLQLLVWRSGAWPLGLWIGAGGAAGALVSGTALLGLTATRARPGRRRISRPFPPRDRPAPAATGDRDDVAQEAWGATAAETWVAPPSEPGEAPTIAVPFRVLRRGSADTGTARSVSGDREEFERRRESGAATAAVADPDDWDAPPPEQW